MSRRRYLSTKTGVDKRVKQLAREAGDYAAVLYLLAIPHAEDDCSLPSDDPEELFDTITPGWPKKTCEDARAAVDAMLSVGLLDSESGSLIFPPESFYRYQSNVPAGKRRKKTAKNAEERRESARNAASPSPSPSPSPSSAKAPREELTVAAKSEALRHSKRGNGSQKIGDLTSKALDEVRGK